MSDAQPSTSTTTPTARGDVNSASTTSSSSSSASAEKVGEGASGGVKGIFNTIHGAGDVLRGNINNALDGLGNGIAGRSSQDAPETRSHDRHTDVATTGQAEFRKGVGELKGLSKHLGGQGRNTQGEDGL